PVGDQTTERVRGTTAPGRLQRGQVAHHVRHLGVDGTGRGASSSTGTGDLGTVDFESGHDLSLVGAVPGARLMSATLGVVPVMLPSCRGGVVDSGARTVRAAPQCPRCPGRSGPARPRWISCRLGGAA